MNRQNWPIKEWDGERVAAKLGVRKSRVSALRKSLESRWLARLWVRNM